MDKVKFKKPEYLGLIDKEFDDWCALDLSPDKLCGLYSDQEPYRGTSNATLGNYVPVGKAKSRYKAKLPPKSERYYQKLVGKKEARKEELREKERQKKRKKFVQELKGGMFFVVPYRLSKDYMEAIEKHTDLDYSIDCDGGYYTKIYVTKKGR